MYGTNSTLHPTVFHKQTANIQLGDETREEREMSFRERERECVRACVHTCGRVFGYAYMCMVWRSSTCVLVCVHTPLLTYSLEIRREKRERDVEECVSVCGCVCLCVCICMISVRVHTHLQSLYCSGRNPLHHHHNHIASDLVVTQRLSKDKCPPHPPIVSNLHTGWWACVFVCSWQHTTKYVCDCSCGNTATS